MSERADYVAALKTERQMLAGVPKPNERRLAEIDRQLDQFKDEPKAPKEEAAVPGPISSARTKVRK